ncbi:MAG: hypothetical protein ACTSQY_05825 [Candidatus Odinarchaeia archaeon]
MGVFSLGEVITYIIRGNELKEKIGDITLRISSTKHEDSFRVISNEKYSRIFKEIILTDDFLKILFFLRKEINISYPKPKVEFSFFINPDEEFLEEIKEYKDAIKRVNEKLNEFNNSLTNISTDNFLVILKLLFRNSKFRTLLRSGGRQNRQKFNEILKSVISSNDTMLKEKWANLIELLQKFEVLSGYIDLKQAYDHLDDAIKNFESLKEIYPEFKNKPEFFYKSVQSLAGNNICEVKTKSVCLECHLRSRKDPSVFTEERNYVTRVVFPENCSNCNGKTIFNILKLEVEPSLAELIRTNRLNEVIIGHLLSQVEGVKKIYVHKNIQKVSNKGFFHSCEVDALAITRDNKIIIGETTTIKDLDHITAEIFKKIDLYDKNEIPFDLMIYFTSSPELKEYLTIKNKQIYVFGIKQIPKTKEYVEFFLKSRK